MHRRLYKVERISFRCVGLYSRNFGSAGGWHLLKAFMDEEEAYDFLNKMDDR